MYPWPLFLLNFRLCSNLVGPIAAGANVSLFCPDLGASALNNTAAFPLLMGLINATFFGSLNATQREGVRGYATGRTELDVPPPPTSSNNGGGGNGGGGGGGGGAGSDRRPMPLNSTRGTAAALVNLTAGLPDLNVHPEALMAALPPDLAALLGGLKDNFNKVRAGGPSGESES